MTRRSQRLIFYTLALGALILGALVIYLTTGSYVAILIYAVILLVPGRIGGLYLKNLFLSRSLLNRSRPAEAIDAGHRLLVELERQPWRRFFIFCFWGVYTWNVEAMALNNIGAAYLEMGKLDQSEDYLQRAIEKDASYAIPYANLAIISYARGNKMEGNRLINIAKKYGYTGAVEDQIISKVAAAYANVQSFRSA